MFFTAFFNHNEQLKRFMCDELNRIKTVITGPLFSAADLDCEKSQKSFFCHRTPFQMSLLLAYDISDPENKKVAKLIDFGRTYPNDQVDSQVAAKQQESICEALENIKKLISGSKVILHWVRCKFFLKVSFNYNLTLEKGLYICFFNRE